MSFADPFGLAADTIRADQSDPRAGELQAAYASGKNAASADTDKGNGAFVARSLSSMERSKRVFLLRNGKVAGTGSEYGNYENGIVTVDLDAIAGSGVTTAAFVTIHELGHGYAQDFLGQPEGFTEAVARMTFENAARRGANQPVRKLTDLRYPQLRQP